MHIVLEYLPHNAAPVEQWRGLLDEFLANNPDLPPEDVVALQAQVPGSWHEINLGAGGVIRLTRIDGLPPQADVLRDAHVYLDERGRPAADTLAAAYDLLVQDAGTDCECDSTHERHGVVCILCACRATLLAQAVPPDYTDCLCECGHWYEEHAGHCTAPDCACQGFVFAPELNTPEVIAGSSGQHDPSCRCARCAPTRFAALTPVEV